MPYLPNYPTLDQAVVAAKQISECIQDGLAEGDILAHIKTHRALFGWSTWTAAGYLRQITLGHPDDVQPIGLAAAPSEFLHEWMSVEAQYAADQGGLTTAGPLNWLAIIIWLLQLLDRTN